MKIRSTYSMNSTRVGDPMRRAGTAVTQNPSSAPSEEDGQGEPDTQPSENRDPETRTTASEGQSCARCGGPIKGRRRNGFCSDKCRLEVLRERAAKRRRGLLWRFKNAVADLEAEWFPGGLGSGGHDER